MATKSASVRLRILCVNDVYKPKQFSIFKALQIKYETEEFKTIAMFPGDFLGGSMFAVKHKGESMMDIFNDVGFDYVTLGNHEFDYGAEALQVFIEKSNFKWLGSNVRYSKTHDVFSKILDYDIFEIPSDDCNISVKIGIFGLTTSDTPMLSHPGELVEFQSCEYHSKRVSEYLKGEKHCDIVLAMTHLSIEQDKIIADSSNGCIDVIIGGHDHEPYIMKQNGVLLVKCGQNIDYLGVIDLFICIKTSGKRMITGCDVKRTVTCRHSVQLLSTHDEKSDPTLDEKIRKWEMKPAINDKGSIMFSKLNIDLNEVLTIVDENSSQDLSTKSSDCRRMETSFCCLLADAYKWYFNEQLNFKCDFAIQNGGFIRADEVYPPLTPIIRSIVAENLPFPQHATLISMSGRDVLHSIEQMLPKGPSAAPVGSFPHFSSGLTACYCLDTAKIANKLGQKVVELKVDGISIDLDKSYSVATTSFYVFDCGDNVTAFNNKPIICDHTAEICESIMVAYLRTLDTISGEPPLRLINLES